MWRVFAIAITEPQTEWGGNTTQGTASEHKNTDRVIMIHTMK